MLTLKDIQEALGPLDFAYDFNYDRIGVYFNPNVESSLSNRYTHKLLIDINTKKVRMNFESGVYVSAAEPLEVCDVYTRIKSLVVLFGLEFVR